jgi:hypothetical protein
MVVGLFKSLLVVAHTLKEEKAGLEPGAIMMNKSLPGPL